MQSGAQSPAQPISELWLPGTVTRRSPPGSSGSPAAIVSTPVAVSRLNVAVGVSDVTENATLPPAAVP